MFSFRLVRCLFKTSANIWTNNVLTGISSHYFLASSLFVSSGLANIWTSNVLHRVVLQSFEKPTLHNFT